MGADATLVNMAYRAAMAKSPGDWSKSFDKQYEGIIAANQALANIGIKAVGAGKEITLAYQERRGKEQEFKKEAFKGVLEARTLDEAINGAADTLIKNTAAEYTYKNGEGLNPIIRKAAYDVPTDIYNNITERNKKVFKSQEDKQYIAEQYARLESWKSDRIKDKGSIKTLVSLINTDGVNLELMDPEYKALLAQLINNKDDISEKGIRIYNRKSDDKLMIDFTPNRMENEAEYNKRMRITDDDAPFEYPAIQPYSAGTTQKAGLQSVSFDDLMSNISKRELKLQGDLVEVIGGVSTIAGAMRTKSKTFITPEWDDGSVNSGKAQLTRSVNNMFAGKGRKEIADLSTTDFFGTGSTYRKDLTNLVEGMDLSAMGIEDKGDPGYEDDFARGDLIKEEIIGRLINPKTPSDVKNALLQMKDYYVDMGEEIFNTTRTALVNEQNEIKNRASGKTVTTKTVDLPWQKGFKEPTNQLHTAQLDLVRDVLSGDKEVPVGNDIYALQKNGKYKIISSQTGGKGFEVKSDVMLTKQQLIKRYGGAYGNIPDDYFDKVFVDHDKLSPTPAIETSKYLKDLKKSGKKNLG